MEKNDLLLLYYVQMAFLGLIRNSVRGIAFNYSNDIIRLDVYYDSKPLDDDYDIISEASTEIMAHIPNIQGEEINLIECYDKNIISIHNGTDKKWFYLRYENNNDENI